MQSLIQIALIHLFLQNALGKEHYNRVAASLIFIKLEFELKLSENDEKLK